MAMGKVIIGPRMGVGPTLMCDTAIFLRWILFVRVLGEAGKCINYCRREISTMCRPAGIVEMGWVGESATNPARYRSEFRCCQPNLIKHQGIIL